MITAYLWIAKTGEPPWHTSEDMHAAVVPEHPQVNANYPIRWDRNAAITKGLIVEAYNREVAPDPAITLADVEFVAPPTNWENPNDRQAEDITVVKARKW